MGWIGIASAATAGLSLLAGGLAAYVVHLRQARREELKGMENAAQNFRDLKVLEDRYNKLTGIIHQTSSEMKDLNDVSIALIAKYKELGQSFDLFGKSAERFQEERKAAIKAEIENLEARKKLVIKVNEMYDIKDTREIDRINEALEVQYINFKNINREVAAAVPAITTLDTAYAKLSEELERLAAMQQMVGMYGPQPGVFGAGAAAASSDSIKKQQGLIESTRNNVRHLRAQFTEGLDFAAGKLSSKRSIELALKDWYAALDAYNAASSQAEIETKHKTLMEKSALVNKYLKERDDKIKEANDKELADAKKLANAQLAIARGLLESKRALNRSGLSGSPFLSSIYEAGVSRNEGMGASKSAEESLNVEKKFFMDLKNIGREAWKTINENHAASLKERNKNQKRANEEYKRLTRQLLDAEKQIARAISDDAETRYKIEIDRIDTQIKMWEDVAAAAVKAALAADAVGKATEAAFLRSKAAGITAGLPAAKVGLTENAQYERAIGGNDYWAGYTAQVRKSAKELKEWGKVGERAAENMESSMTTFFSSIMTGTKTAKEAFNDFITSIGNHFANEVAKMIAKMLMLQLISGKNAVAVGVDKVGLVLRAAGAIGGMFSGGGGAPGGGAPGGGGMATSMAGMGNLDFANIGTGPAYTKPPKGGGGDTILELTLVNNVTGQAISSALGGKEGKNLITNHITAGAGRPTKIRKAIKQAATQ